MFAILFGHIDTMARNMVELQFCYSTIRPSNIVIQPSRCRRRFYLDLRSLSPILIYDNNLTFLAGCDNNMIIIKENKTRFSTGNFIASMYITWTYSLTISIQIYVDPTTYINSWGGGGGGLRRQKNPYSFPSCFCNHSSKSMEIF